MSSRLCGDCQEPLPTGARSRYCPSCRAERHRAYQREYRRAHPDKQRAYKHRWQERHPEQHAAYRRAYRHEHRDELQEYVRRYRKEHPEWAADWSQRYAERRRDNRLRRVHGITTEQFREIHQRQGGKCPICLREIPAEFLTREELRRVEVRPHVDHDHATDEVRGILCATCNQGIGLLQEDPDAFRRAAAYLAGQYPRITPRRTGRLANGDKTHCDRGHPFDEENTRVLPNGRRRCRTCDRERVPGRPRVRTCVDCGATISAAGYRCRTCAGRARRSHPSSDA